MKRFVLLIAACFCYIYGFTAYLRDIPVTVTQPDGTVLHCFASGDEFFNYLHDKQGYTIIQHPVTGYYVYADKQDNKLVATDLIAGRTNPTAKNLMPHNLISSEEWTQRRKAWEAEHPRPKNRDGQPNHGTLNNIAIFIRFSDEVEFVNSFSDINDMFNDLTGNYGKSMRSYFRAASYGAIDIPTTFYPGHNGENIISYQDTYPRSYFQPYNSSTNPNGYQDYNERRSREFDLLERAVIYVNTNYPIPSGLNIDYDNDGFVDNVCFIVRGDTGEWSDLLWPHKWSLYDRDVYLNDKIVDVFNFQLADDRRYFTTSTMCHEMNHSLSAPDLYHYEDDWDDLSPVGKWDLMESNSTPPQHCGAYMKMKYGHWIDEIPEITQAGTYTLNPISSATPENIAYKIPTDDPKQFYVLEYRNKSVEEAVYGSGLLVYRIDTRFDGNADYNPNEGIYDEVYIFRPNGTATVNGAIKNAHFSSNVNRTQFYYSTNPYPFFTEGVVDNNIKIYDITSAGSTISFSYGSTASCVPPTNLVVSVSGRNATLSWDAMTNAQSYNIYRDGALIANSTSTSFTDSNLPFGTYLYSLKSKDADDRLSTQTVPVTALVQPIPSALAATMEGNAAVLTWTAPEWDYPTSPAVTLTYGSGSSNGGMGTSSAMYWGHRYPMESINDLINKCIYQVSFYARATGDYKLYLYEGSVTGNTVRPQTQVYEQSVNAMSTGWCDITFSSPYQLDNSKDLWVFIYDPEGKSFPAALRNYQGDYGNYYSTRTPTSSISTYSSGKAFAIQTYLGDSYSYNLYDNGNTVASGIPQITYTVHNLTGNTIHQYTVRTNFIGSETAPSNKASIALGTHSLTNLNLENDRMIVAENSKLTVSGNLTCSNPDHLVIENGAQLINDSENVKATAKKAVSPYTLGLNDGWNLIASPVIESLNAEDDVEGLLGDIYDLFLFDQSNTDENGVLKEWRNYKAGSFSSIDHKTGYLYAKGEETTLSFVGTLAGTAEDTELTLVAGTEFAGFNLIGNPYPCNTYLGRPFYVLEYDPESDTTSFVLGNNDNPIAPCTAILVQAQTDGESVAFSKEQIENPSRIAVSLTQADQKGATAIDQARIVFQQQCQLAKYPQRGSAPMLYIPKNGEKLAVADSDGQAEMPINLQVTKNGTYTLTFDTENVDLGYLHLIDNMTGDDVDLLSTPSYTFEANVNDHAWRFRLVFSNEKDIADNNEAFAFISNGSIIVNQDGVLQIVDMTGRVVEYGDAKHCVSTREMTPGVYVLRLIDGDNVKTQKIVIE